MKKFIIIAVSIILIASSALIAGRYILLPAMWNFLIVNQDPKPADVIIVLSAGEERVAKGVELYQEGYADKVIFSGGSSDNMGKQAQALGLPADAILLDEDSYTTYTNAKYSLQIVEAQGFKSAIIVTSAYHTKRSSLIFKHFFKGIDLTICAAAYDPELEQTWWKNSESANWVISEYLKLGFYCLFERWLFQF